MNRLILRAKRKRNWYNKKGKITQQSDSDASLSSDDEEEVSKDIVGHWFDGRYIAIKYLGRGTYSRVWLIYNVEEKEYYAMKMIMAEYFDEAIHELKIYKKLGKLNEDSRLVKIKEHFCFNDNNKVVCIILEFMGICIIDLFKKYSNENIPITLIKKVFTDILLGLEELDSKKIIHTDLKAENVMINIYTYKINKLKTWFSSLEIPKLYYDSITIELPMDYSSYNSDRRKKVKRKTRLRVQKKITIYIKQKIEIYNELLKKERKEQCNEIKEIDDIDDLDEFELHDYDKNDNFDYNEPELEKYTTKIIDFGNAELQEKRKQGEIQLRVYRPPENIINLFYDTKADIWSFGCILYETLTDEYLFNINGKDSFEKDRNHLHQMYELFGKMPRTMAENCEFSEELFDAKGRILKHRTCDYKDFHLYLKERIVNKFLCEDEIKNLSDLLLSIFKYNPKERFSARDCLEHKWFKWFERVECFKEFNCKETNSELNSNENVDISSSNQNTCEGISN